MGHIEPLMNNSHLINATLDYLSYDVHPVEMFTFASLISGNIN
jgi:hypothetical protein